MYDRVLELLTEGIPMGPNPLAPQGRFPTGSRKAQRKAARRAVAGMKPTPDRPKPSLADQIGRGSEVDNRKRGQNIGSMDDIRTRPRTVKPIPADTPDIENPDVDMPPGPIKDKDEFEAKRKRMEAGAEALRQAGERARRGDAEGTADEMEKADAIAGKPGKSREEILGSIRKLQARKYNQDSFKGKAYGVGDMSDLEFDRYVEKHPMRPKGMDDRAKFYFNMSDIRRKKRAQKTLDRFRSFGGGLVAGIKAGGAAATPTPRISAPRKFM